MTIYSYINKILLTYVQYRTNLGSNLKLHFVRWFYMAQVYFVQVAIYICSS